MVIPSIEVTKEDCEVRNELNRLPKTMRMFYDMVLDSSKGVSILPIHSKLVFSTNKGTQYVYKGTKGEGDAFSLLLSHHVKEER